MAYTRLKTYLSQFRPGQVADATELLMGSLQRSLKEAGVDGAHCSSPRISPRLGFSALLPPPRNIPPPPESESY